MSALSSLSGESVKGLGAGAYLVSALPSAVLVLSGTALVISRLYPWASPVIDPDDGPVAPGLDSIVYAVQQASTTGLVVVTLLVLVSTVLLRPFQIALVQVLEGYWRGGRLRRLRVARHMTRHSIAKTRAEAVRRDRPEFRDASSVASYALRLRKAQELQERADEALTYYPDDGHLVMPTALGNVLRMAETSAGERYGLDTVVMFPRLYPFLSSRLEEEYREQVNILDASAAFTLLFSILGFLSAPLLWRMDAWAFAPIIAVIAAAVSYRGACMAARHVAWQQATAFDLHRFEMLQAMRQRLPRHGLEEQHVNQLLSSAVAGDAASLADLRYTPAEQSKLSSRSKQS